MARRRITRGRVENDEIRKIALRNGVSVHAVRSAVVELLERNTQNQLLTKERVIDKFVVDVRSPKTLRVLSKSRSLGRRSTLRSPKRTGKRGVSASFPAVSEPSVFRGAKIVSVDVGFLKRISDSISITKYEDGKFSVAVSKRGGDDTDDPGAGISR